MVATTLTSTTKVAVLAEAWWTDINTAERSPGTLRLYCNRLDRQVIPALGTLRLAELTVGTIDRHLRQVTETNRVGVAQGRSIRAQAACAGSPALTAGPAPTGHTTDPFPQDRCRPSPTRWAMQSDL